MSDPNLADIATGAGGATGVLGGLYLLITRLFKRDDEVAELLAKLVKDIGDMRSDMRLLTQGLDTHKGEVLEVKARVNGLSENHGKRLAKLEERTTRIMERLAMRAEVEEAEQS